MYMHKQTCTFHLYPPSVREMKKGKMMLSGDCFASLGSILYNMSRSWIEAIIESEDTFLSHGDYLSDGRPMGSIAIALNFESKQ